MSYKERKSDECEALHDDARQVHEGEELTSSVSLSLESKGLIQQEKWCYLIHMATVKRFKCKDLLLENVLLFFLLPTMNC